MRHLISGEDCAIAGEATAAVAAAPAADTFRKSRRFIFRSLLVGAFPRTSSFAAAHSDDAMWTASNRRGFAAVAFNTEALAAERDIGMTGGDQSRMSPDNRLKRLR
jgi:hypothetical protein